MQRVRLSISGRVQGVGYRYAACDTAEALHLVGEVRNTADGRVECVAEGNREDLESFVDWCRTGPSMARVTSVDVEWERASGAFSAFRIAR